METETLEELLGGGSENQKIEFKGACNWGIGTFAKGILALSNVDNGGFIIVGIENETLTRQGISTLQKESFNFDIMKDQIAPYADPHVDFKVEFVKDKNEKEFAVIQVFPFEDIPVICCKDSNSLKAGVIYYRSRRGRPQSSPVSNAFDMRDITERAAIKLMRRTKELGLNVSESAKEKLDEELGDL